MSVPELSSIQGRSSAIHRLFLCCPMCRNLHPILKIRASKTCMPAILCWPSIAVSTCCAITTFARWVNFWWYCGGHGMSVYCYIGSEVYCPFRRCYKKVEYERDPSTLLQRFDVHTLPKIGPSLVFSIVCVVTCHWPSASIIGQVIAILSFVSVIMHEGY